MGSDGWVYADGRLPTAGWTQCPPGLVSSVLLVLKQGPRSRASNLPSPGGQAGSRRFATDRNASYECELCGVRARCARSADRMTPEPPRANSARAAAAGVAASPRSNPRRAGGRERATTASF